MGLAIAWILAGALAAQAASDEMIVFKKDSPYKGGAMRVASHEKRGERIVLKTADGNLFSVADGTIDWETTAKATEQLRAREDAANALQAADEKARQEREARLESEHELTLVEASRRFGVDNPGMSVSSGSAAREVVPIAPTGGSAEAAPASGEGDKVAQVKLEAAKKERDAVKKQVDALKADKNPDPLWSAKRKARLEEKEAELRSAEERVQAAQKALDEAKKAAQPK